MRSRTGLGAATSPLRGSGAGGLTPGPGLAPPGLQPPPLRGENKTRRGGLMAVFAPGGATSTGSTCATTRTCSTSSTGQAQRDALAAGGRTAHGEDLDAPGVGHRMGRPAPLHRPPHQRRGLRCGTAGQLPAARRAGAPAQVRRGRGLHRPAAHSAGGIQLLLAMSPGEWSILERAAKAAKGESIPRTSTTSTP